MIDEKINKITIFEIDYLFSTCINPDIFKTFSFANIDVAYWNIALFFIFIA